MIEKQYGNSGAFVPLTKKHLMFAAVFLVIMAITGCKRVSPAAENISEIQEDRSSALNSEQISDNSEAQNEQPPEALNRAELDKILGVFNELAYLNTGLHPDFDYTASACDHIPDCIDISNHFSEKIESYNGLREYTYNYYLVKSGDYSTESGFNNKLGEIFTEDFKDKYLEYAKNNFRFKDGQTYVSDMEYLGNEPISFRIETAAEITDKGVAVTLTDDYGNTAAVKLEKGSDGKYRISEADDISRLSNWFCFDRALDLVCGDVEINRPSTRNTTVSSKYPELWSKTRFEQCVSMLRDYAYIERELGARVKFEAENYVTDEQSDKTFYKLNDDHKLADENIFEQQLKLIFTSNALEKYINAADRNFTFKDGKVYIAENPPQKIIAGANGCLELNAFDIDENAALMTITAANVVEGNDCKFTIKFVKEGDFYKIDEITADSEVIDLAECVWFYSALVYGDISVSL